MIASCSNTKKIPLSGLFESNGEKTIQWLIESEHSWTKKDNWEKYKEIYKTDNPLIHSWSDGNLKVLLSEGEHLETQNNWSHEGENTFKKIVSSDNMKYDEFVTLRMISVDEYFIDTEVNKVVHREYFIRKNREQDSAHQSTTGFESKSK